MPLPALKATGGDAGATTSVKSHRRGRRCYYQLQKPPAGTPVLLLGFESPTLGDGEPGILCKCGVGVGERAPNDPASAVVHNNFSMDAPFAETSGGVRRAFRRAHVHAFGSIGIDRP